jgi:hypothetical protein
MVDFGRPFSLRICLIEYPIKSNARITAIVSGECSRRAVLGLEGILGVYVDFMIEREVLERLWGGQN